LRIARNIGVSFTDMQGNHFLKTLLMIRTSTISPQEANLSAVSALDELVFGLVQAVPFKLSCGFLDWVADEATPLVEHQLAQSFGHPLFAASLRRGDHRIALARWVGHWVGPHIASCFGELAAYLPQSDGPPAHLWPAAVIPVADKPAHPWWSAPHPVAAAVRAAF
jgi:hypothetical protein